MDRRAHGGDRYGHSISLDFSINVNPLGMPEEAKRVLRRSVGSWSGYPDPECRRLRQALSRRWNVAEEWILCGNGAADLIYQLAWALRPKRALVLAPTFSEYGCALESVGCQTDCFFLKREENFAVCMDRLAQAVTPEHDLVFFCNPNNPTGQVVPVREVERLARVCGEKGAVLAVDECFLPFLKEERSCSALPLAAACPNLVVLRAFTKIYAMAGLRLGCGVCSRELLWSQVKRLRQPWSVSIPAQEAGIAALEANGYLEQTWELLDRERPRVTQGLLALGAKVWEGKANYLLFSFPWDRDGWFYEQCRSRGILIRDCSNYIGLAPGDYRICIGRREQNRFFFKTAAEVMEGKTESNRESQRLSERK